MSTVQEIFDGIAEADADQAEKFKNEMVAALMDTDSGFTAKGSAGLRAVAASWVAQRDFLKKMQDPAFRAMAVGVVAEQYGVEIPIEAELAALSTEPEGTPDDADAETEPSFS